MPSIKRLDTLIAVINAKSSHGQMDANPQKIRIRKCGQVTNLKKKKKKRPEKSLKKIQRKFYKIINKNKKS